MKILTLITVVVLIGIATAKKGKWKQNKDWKKKKQWKMANANAVNKKLEILDTDGSELMINPKEYEDDTAPRTFKLNHYFGKKVFKNKKAKSGKRQRKMSKGKKKLHKAMQWLKTLANEDCDADCKEGEVCVIGPTLTHPICVYKLDLKKSMKTFHKYHKNKKEMKTWRKFSKKQHKKKYGKKYHKMAKYAKKIEKFEKYPDKYAKVEKFRRKMEKLGKKFDLDGRYKMKSEKSHKGKKMDMDELEEKTHQPADKTIGKQEADCSGSNMMQMKNRLMGWFHLLHGQDRDERKAHGGSIGKFYKQVSVKKETIELNGEKCECFKSAVWQFVQLDKSRDDHLTKEELAYLLDNSVEPCLKPYFLSCDRDGDEKISKDEWCCCFAHALPPCFSAFSKIKKEAKSVSYLPRCDKEGYYLLEQCKGDKKDGTYECWCVDFNGNEYKDTLNKGRAHCHKIKQLSYKQKLPLM